MDSPSEREVPRRRSPYQGHKTAARGVKDFQRKFEDLVVGLIAALRSPASIEEELSERHSIFFNVADDTAS